MFALVFFATFAFFLTVKAATTDHSKEPRQGWTSQPDGRGTLDIIWTCSLTMGLCSWSIICINMPGLNESKWLVLWRKFALSALGIMCPEVLLSMGASQWVGARQCVKDFASLASEPCAVNDPESQTTTTSSPEKDTDREVIDLPKAFYIDMGGFRVKPKGTDSFPANGKDIYWLVKEGYVKQPLFKRSTMIDEKNKVDPLLRIITIIQISYFMIGVIARWVQHLFVTTAELTTFSFVFCSILGAGFWWHKPCDVIAPEILEIDLTQEELIEKTRASPEDKRMWYLTPMDLVSRKEWWWSKVWWNYLNILKAGGLCFGSESPKHQHIDRIADSVQRPLPRQQQYMILGVTTGCFIIFFAAWNDVFPTQIERTVWRVVCVVLMAMLYAGLVISEILQAYERVSKPKDTTAKRIFDEGLAQIGAWMQYILRRSKPMPCSSGPSRRSPGLQVILDRVTLIFDKLRNNSPNDDPNLKLPLKVVLNFYVMGFVYFFCRSYILLEDAIGLREQPASAYATVNWHKFWPHLG
ncbi:MAG: hypothetical protein Q9169_007676 [Polycauliona sp. 2 TL-2023]